MQYSLAVERKTEIPSRNSSQLEKRYVIEIQYLFEPWP